MLLLLVCLADDGAGVDRAGAVLAVLLGLVLIVGRPGHAAAVGAWAEGGRWHWITAPSFPAARGWPAGRIGW